MTLQKFNIPVEIIDLIATLEPENQGIIYSHLFAYIYHGTPVPDSVDPRCRLILRMIIEKIDRRVTRAHAKAARPEATTPAAPAKAAKAAKPAKPAKAIDDSIGQRIIDNARRTTRPLGTMAQAMYDARIRRSLRHG